MTERDLTKIVIAMAHKYGWVVSHFHTARAARNGAWVTPASADGKGFPDLVLVRERLLFAELKAGSNSLRAEQKDWLGALEAAGAEVYVWRERDLEEIERILETNISLERLQRLIYASGGDALHARRIAIGLANKKGGPKAALVSTTNQKEATGVGTERRLN